MNAFPIARHSIQRAEHVQAELAAARNVIPKKLDPWARESGPAAQPPQRHPAAPSLAFAAALVRVKRRPGASRAACKGNRAVQHAFVEVQISH